MFEREHHRAIALILEVLDGAFLEQNHCLFGGGTAIALKHGEYRESIDVDFLVSDIAGYRTLRQTLSTRDGIKFEIVLEGRIQLQPPGPADHIGTIATLTALDMATTKLLANADRWADDSVNSRDLIDLAMLALDKKTLEAAIQKASGAYGASIERDLAKAIEALKRRPGRLGDCMEALQMTDAPKGVTSVPPALLWQRVRRLKPAPHRSPTAT